MDRAQNPKTHKRNFQEGYKSARDLRNYTPGRGELVILQAGHPGRSRAIALWHLMKLRRCPKRVCELPNFWLIHMKTILVLYLCSWLLQLRHRAVPIEEKYRVGKQTVVYALQHCLNDS